MSLTINNLITNEDFNALRTRVINECKRRNMTNPLTVPTVLSKNDNEIILYSDIQNLLSSLTPLDAFPNSNLDANTYIYLNNSEQIVQLKNFQNQIIKDLGSINSTLASAEPQIQYSNTDCRGNCAGLCTSCQGCSDSCSTSCTNTCKGGCSGCGSGCAGGCTSTCGGCGGCGECGGCGGCSGNCYDGCTDYANRRSKLIFKENIHIFNQNALDIIKETKIVDFNYKDDPEKNYKVGFIADNTNEILSTKNHDQMDMYNCIGILIKAVQEIDKELINIKEVLNKNG